MSNKISYFDDKYWIIHCGSAVKNSPAMQEPQETRVQSLGQEDPLEKGMATHSSTLAWKIPRTEEPGGLQSMGCTESAQLKRLSTHARTEKVQALGRPFDITW